MIDPNPQRKAQQRVDRIAAFRAELAELEREQELTLTADQRTRLDAHLEGVLSSFRREFGVDITDTARRISWGMRVASLLGGAALFAALVLFLHRIWGVLPFSAQFGVLTLMPLLLLAALEFAHRRGASAYSKALLGLAAGTAFVLELDALGSVLNLASSAHALLVWALFAILVAYAFGLRLLLGAGLVLLCAYTGALITALGGGHWESFLQRTASLLPAAAILYAIPELRRRRHLRNSGAVSESDGSREDNAQTPSAPQPPQIASRSFETGYFDFVYRVCGAGLVFVALLILSKAADLCCSGPAASAAETGCQLLGLVLSGAVVFHGLQLTRTGLVNLGAGAFVVFLYVRLHDWWWDWMPKYLFFLLIGLTALGLLLAFRRLRRRMSERSLA